MSYDALMVHSCYIGSVTTTTNSLGEPRQIWTYSTTATTCRVVPVTLEERQKLGGEYQDIIYKVYMKSGAAVELGGRIKYGSDYYLVRQRYYDSSSHHITCLVKGL